MTPRRGERWRKLRKDCSVKIRLETVVDYHVNDGYDRSVAICGFNGYILNI